MILWRMHDASRFSLSRPQRPIGNTGDFVIRSTGPLLARRRHHRGIRHGMSTQVVNVSPTSLIDHISLVLLIRPRLQHDASILFFSSSFIFYRGVGPLCCVISLSRYRPKKKLVMGLFFSTACR
ncbi:hypothetical protein M441DRAFT_249170 [Trichoderma asperellum CBS 433.97]|uniref:Uncharacterized protein n=1 Tax=Trichoderma asperellum (strain ATCC 204424 / CBS 433.97 / NBRC 101777) TaxID=1042311 RepID=A0A2T3Z0F4_TRIA4|nr:hypothetical protein M441DRAFT_249170 [Trichoderma asperellum CBS 433.97]PTB38250.1 hypothetical protein M441DRAFT_249170 [Trichoderma asperellum CBS 433.97]